MNKIKRLLQKIRLNDIAALFAGAITPLAFAPFYLWIIAVITPAVYLLSLIKLTPIRALWCGWLFGLGMFGVGVSWIFISIHEFGNTSLPLAVLLTAIFVMVLALFPAIQAYLFTKYFPKNNFIKFTLAFPIIWVLVEWVRSWILTGFPWILLGFSQTNSPLRGYIPLIGAYGVAFLVLFSSGLISFCLYRGKNAGCKILIGWLILIMIWGGGELLAKIHWTSPLGKPLKVALVQGNIPQELKWNPEHIIPTLRIYTAATQPHWNSDIIIWPEAAIPIPLHFAKQFIDELDSAAKIHHATLITGIPAQAPNSRSFYNAIIVLGMGSGHYYKRHLVPFGEYVPFGDLLRGVMGLLNLPMSDLISGPEKQPDLLAQGIKIAPFICYEIAYSGDLFRELPQAKILVTISNDAWFGDSFAPAQHLQIGQFRAIQGGRELLFVGNNGITAIVNSQGRIVSVLPQFKEGVLTGIVQPMQGTTPWVYYSDAPIILFFFLGIFGLVYFEKWRSNNPGKNF